MEAVRVTHVVENLDRGGLERVVIDLARAQREAGYACEVVCLFERGALASELDAAGVPVYACRKRDGIDLAAIRRLRGHLRRHRPAILHTHNATAHYYAIAASLGLPLQRRVNTRHGMGVQQARQRREWLFRRTLPFTDVVVTVCEAARREVLLRGLIPAGRLTAVPNGIRLEVFAPASTAAREELCASLGLPAGTRLIGSVGRLNRAKDPITLVRSFARLRKRLPDVALVLIGDGALREDVEKCVAGEGVGDHVRLLGDRSDVPGLLAGLDLFVIASITEGYSIALLEACAAGLPIVATRVGGNEEIVRDHINGRLAEPGDPEALAATMFEVLSDAEEARRRGREGREWVRRQGSLAAMLARYALVYGLAGFQG